MNVPVKRNASIGAYRKQYEQQRKQKIKKIAVAGFAFVALLLLVVSFFNSVTIVVPQSLSGAMLPLSLKYGITHLSMVHMRVVPDSELTSSTIADVMKREGASLCIWPNSINDGLGTTDKLGDLKEVAAKNYDRLMVMPYSTAVNPVDDSKTASTDGQGVIKGESSLNYGNSDGAEATAAAIKEAGGIPSNEELQNDTAKSKEEDQEQAAKKAEDAKKAAAKAGDSSGHAPEFWGGCKYSFSR